jgi:SAM-dependent methyltransferase
VVARRPARQHFEVVDDATAFYGRAYWLEYQRGREMPDIFARARADLSERCVFWLRKILDVVRPPGRSLELGCGHGGFVRLMQELGFDAMGTELSPWIVEFACRRFGVPVLRGTLEQLDLDPGFRCIAALDVLEHLDDPPGTLRRCAGLLDAGGVLVLQTPCYRGEGPDWAMFQPDEHVHLFTEDSIRALLARAGFRAVGVSPALFPYDMWVTAALERLPELPPAVAAGDGAWQLPAAFTALLDADSMVSRLRADLALAQEAAAARLEHAEELTRLLRESEADRLARLEGIRELTRLLEESEADRAARLQGIHELTRRLEESQEDREARLRLLQEADAARKALGAQLATVEAALARMRDHPLGRLYGQLERLRHREGH